MAESLLDVTTTIEVVDPRVRTIVQEGGLENLPDYLKEENLANGGVYVITDSNVYEKYGDTVGDALDNAGIRFGIFEIPPGEANKTLEVVGTAIDTLADKGVNRGDTIVALGGGMVGDLVGFVASIYNRGVSVVQAPTTLLAMVDSSIGGKTGVDHGGKNKTGTFYQPKLVVADPKVLETLDERVYTEGFGEIVKYGFLEADFLPELEAQAPNLRRFQSSNLAVLGKIIARSVEQKTRVVEADPHELAPDGRILLNYGHTLGHGLEAAGGYTELLHGEGVAVGMMYAAKLAVHLGLAEQALVDRQSSLLEVLGLPTRYEGSASIGDIMGNVAKDKKNTASGSTRFVLPKNPGEMEVRKVDNATVETTLEEFLAA